MRENKDERLVRVANARETRPSSMASQQPVVACAPRVVDLTSPRFGVNFDSPPLHIRQRHSATQHPRIARHLSHPPIHRNINGPLDDIIHEISCALWSISSSARVEWGSEESEDPLHTALGWQNPLKHPPQSTLLYSSNTTTTFTRTYFN